MNKYFNEQAQTFQIYPKTLLCTLKFVTDIFYFIRFIPYNFLRLLMSVACSFNLYIFLFYLSLRLNIFWAPAVFPPILCPISICPALYPYFFAFYVYTPLTRNFLGFTTSVSKIIDKIDTNFI